VNRIIALPYLVPCTHVDIDLYNFVNYKKQCLEQFHVCCLIGKMHGKRIPILSLELILAGNDTILMDRFLVQLANVANKHDVYFHIDKVFTAGRMEYSFLLTQSKPANFIARVFFDSVDGKMDRGWAGPCDHTGKRGISTPIPMYCEQALNRFAYVAGDGRLNIASQCAALISYIGWCDRRLLLG
jgi:hypothetical protein